MLNKRNIIPAIIALAVTLVLLFLINLLRKPNSSETTQIVPELKLMPGDGQSTQPAQELFVTPTSQVFSTLPAPQAGISFDDEPYFGGYMGDLTLPTGKVKVYSPAFSMDGTLLLPADGMVLWGGHFFGHLIQTHGWLTLNTGDALIWEPANTTKRYLKVSTAEESPGFEKGFETLPKEQFALVTCFIDFTKKYESTNRVFGGNVTYSLLEIQQK